MTQPHSFDLALELREFALSLVRDAPQGGLSRTAAATLSILDRHGPQRITALAEHESVTQPAMTGLVQRLETSGLVTRRPDRADGRATLISITELGVKEIGERRLRHDDAIGARIARLSHTDRALLTAAMPAIHHLTQSESHVHSTH